MASAAPESMTSPTGPAAVAAPAAAAGDPKKDGVAADEVHKHDNEKSCWIVIDGNVYDVTKFLGDHPGGWQEILAFAGCEATGPYNDAGHSRTARKMLGTYLVGPLRPGEAAKLRKSKPAASGGGKEGGCCVQ